MMQKLLDSLTFVFAKTMPQSPHYWVRRTPENEASYVTLFETCWRDGVWHKYKASRYRVWVWGEWMYWPMTSDINQSRIINRAHISELEKRDPDEAARLRTLDWSKGTPDTPPDPISRRARKDPGAPPAVLQL